MGNKYLILTIFLLFFLTGATVKGQSLVAQELPFTKEDASMLREILTWVNFKDSICFQGFLFQRTGIFQDSLSIQGISEIDLSSSEGPPVCWLISESDFLEYVYVLEEQGLPLTHDLFWLCLLL